MHGASPEPRTRFGGYIAVVVPFEDSSLGGRLNGHRSRRRRKECNELERRCFFCGIQLTRENEPEGIIFVCEGDASVPCCTPDWHKRRARGDDDDYRSRKGTRLPWDAGP
jgi:hypothetical protein